MAVEDKKIEFPETQKVMDSYGQIISEEIVALLARKGKNATGVLSNSINYEITLDEDRIELTIVYADYGKYVLSGRRAYGKSDPQKGMPNITAIEKWIRDKKIPVVVEGTKGRTKKQGTGKNAGTGKTKKLTKRGEEKSLAFVIARAIARDGIKPLNFLLPLEQEVEGMQMKKDIKKALVKDGQSAMKAFAIEFNKKTI
jgi:hypothetical protein